MSGNSSLLVDFYELTMAQCYFYHHSKTMATFDLFVRQLPFNRYYLVFAGLEDILGYLKNLKFSPEDLSYLKSKKLFTRAFLDFLKDFRFQGDVWAMPEGSVFFPDEPVVRVTAPIIFAQVVESFFLNTVNLQTMIASKASRVVQAAKGKGVFDFSLRRTQGQDAAIKVARSSYLAGFNGTSCVLAGKLYGIPIAGTMAHSFVMSFQKEEESFSAYSKVFPDSSVLLVDTYNTLNGIKNAVKIGLKLKNSKHRLLGIRLDSGDIVRLSKSARQMLDASGLKYVQIFASGNLDEFKIEEILKKQAPVDNFGVGTNMGTSVDAPYLDAIYKLSEVSRNGKEFLPTMKLSQGKTTYPGRKQVFRAYDGGKRYSRDILGLEGEKISGEPCLRKVVSNGDVIYASPGLLKIRNFTKRNLGLLPEELKKMRAKYKYPVFISPRLKNLRRSLSSQLEERQ